MIRKVLLLHEYPGGFGGAERYLELLAGGLRDAGVETAAVIHAVDPDAAGALVDRLNGAGVQVDLHGGRSWPPALARAVRRLRPDVLHWNAVDPFAFRGGSWMLLPWGRPSVLTDHLPMLRTGPHWETTRKLVNRRLAAVIVVGEQGAAAARQHWPSRWAPRLVVIRNGVATGHGRTRGDLEPGRPVELLFLGRLTEQKDPAFALDVAARLAAKGTNVHLTVAGDGPLRDLLERRVAAAPFLADVVDVTGFATDAAGALDAADVFVLPSRYEGLPLTPLEALAAGAPAVLSDIPPHREIAGAGGEDGGVRLAPLDDVDAWVEAVASVTSTLPASSAAALRLADAFSATDMVAATLRVYDVAVAGT